MAPPTHRTTATSMPVRGTIYSEGVKSSTIADFFGKKKKNIALRKFYRSKSCFREKTTFEVEPRRNRFSLCSTLPSLHSTLVSAGSSRHRTFPHISFRRAWMLNLCQNLQKLLSGKFEIVFGGKPF
ncbi:unnamed protein product [Ixodes persulcatus]